MVQKNILASILINNFNNKVFIKKCIRSCLNQSYKNIEIIVDEINNNFILKRKKYLIVKIGI